MLTQMVGDFGNARYALPAICSDGVRLPVLSKLLHLRRSVHGLRRLANRLLCVSNALRLWAGASSPYEYSRPRCPDLYPGINVEDLHRAGCRSHAEPVSHRAVRRARSDKRLDAPPLFARAILYAHNLFWSGSPTTTSSRRHLRSDQPFSRSELRLLGYNRGALSNLPFDVPCPGVLARGDFYSHQYSSVLV